VRAHLAVKQASNLCDPVLSRAALAEITNAAVSEFRDRETYYAWSSRKASRFFFFRIAFTFIVSIFSNISGVFVQERSGMASPMHFVAGAPIRLDNGRSWRGAAGSSLRCFSRFAAR
jgi:hypothetical protein